MNREELLASLDQEERAFFESLSPVDREVALSAIVEVTNTMLPQVLEKMGETFDITDPKLLDLTKQIIEETEQTLDKRFEELQ